MQDKFQGKIPVVTILFVVINIFVWIFLELSGDTQNALYMLEHGASYMPYVIEDGEWWRLLSCIFLHFGAEHLINNMLLLGVTGARLEHAMGSIPFAILYLMSGLCGNLVSLYTELASEDYSVSAGASGAVFGIIGGLIALALWNKGKIEGLNTRGLLWMAALSLYYGFTTAGVDNWGHIGGLFGGFFIGCVYALLVKIQRPYEK